jgi:hypothetical protein
MTHLFQHRQVSGHEPPLRPGRYTATSDWYAVDRQPRAGESCLAYIQYAKQSGREVRTSPDEFTVEE